MSTLLNLIATHPSLGVVCMDRCSFCGRLEPHDNEEIFWCICTRPALKPKGKKPLDIALEKVTKELEARNEQRCLQKD